MSHPKLLVGTSKGLVVFTFSENAISKVDIHFKGLPVSMVYVDETNHNWWAGLSHRHWGEKLYVSNDQGASWCVSGLPSYQGFDYRPGKPASLKKLWCMSTGGKDPNKLWLGTEPGGLFFSDDYGKSFHLNESLWNHPSRQDDKQWFGTGKDFPFIHSILIDPRDSNHIYAGVSCAGVFESTNGGKSWTPCNNGLVAGYLPKADPEVGHDPHQMLMCQAQPEVIWQQNHCGIFRTRDGGKLWDNVSGKNLVTLSSGAVSRQWPSYGFALAIDNSNPETAWVIPAESDESRIPVDLELQVLKTIDGGANWISYSTGLPQNNAFDLVLRHGFAKYQNILAFGTTNGNLYCSFNLGERWTVLSQNLASVNSVVFNVS